MSGGQPEHTLEISESDDYEEFTLRQATTITLPPISRGGEQVEVTYNGGPPITVKCSEGDQIGFDKSLIKIAGEIIGK